MYEWRKLTDEEREELLAKRQNLKLPWHSVSHRDYDGRFRFIFTATCYEHQPIIGVSPDRLSECEQDILAICQSLDVQVFAWCFLPNHYHLVLETERMKEFGKEIGLYNGRSARRWNLEEQKTGRKVWCNYFERPMRSERHFYASLNYVHHNAVKHGYVARWQDWPFSSVHEYLATVGRERVLELWEEYPVLDYGKGWDW